MCTNYPFKHDLTSFLQRSKKTKLNKHISSVGTVLTITLGSRLLLLHAYCSEGYI